MSDERICPKCGRGGVPARCRVHDACLSSGATSSATYAPDRPSLWHDDETGRFKWSEPVTMDTTCGRRVRTVETNGAPHDCDLAGCKLTKVSEVQIEHRDDIDWSTRDLAVVLAEPPSTFEAGFPEVFFRPRGHNKDEDGESVDVSIPLTRRQILQELDDYEPWLPKELLDEAYSGLVGSGCDTLAEAALVRVREAMDRFHGLVSA